MKQIDAYHLKHKKHEKMHVEHVKKLKNHWMAQGKFADGTKGSVFIKEADAHKLK
jgi:hypothetical protein